MCLMPLSFAPGHIIESLFTLHAQPFILAYVFVTFYIFVGLLILAHDDFYSKNVLSYNHWLYWYICLQQKLKVYLAPFLHGNRYSSFGRHFTKVEKLEEVILPCFLPQGYSSSLSYFSALLDWAITFVPNFSSSNFVDLVNFLDFWPQ